MLRIIILSFFAFSLTACDGKPSDTVEENVKIHDVMAAPKEISEKIYGEYKKNAVVMPIKDVVYYLKEEGTKLVVVQAPSFFTEEERNRIKSGENDFMVLFNKASPNNEIWGWYPYIVTEIKFKSKEINPSNIKSFYLRVYGIVEANSTDNINSYPNQENTFTKLEIKNGSLSLEYSGTSKIMEDSHSWAISI